MSVSGGVNDKYLDRMGRKDWFSNVQAPYFEQAIELRNAKVKSHYVRYFDATSNNVHLIENAAALLQSEQIQPELIERTLQQVEASIREVTKEIEAHTSAGLKVAEDNGVGVEPKFFQESLKVRAKILSPIGFGYLDLLQKADRLILILESLRLRGVIQRADCDRQIAYLGHRMKAVPRCAFELAVGLRHLAKGEVQELRSTEASNDSPVGAMSTGATAGNVKRLNGTKRPSRQRIEKHIPPPSSEVESTASAAVNIG